MIDMERALEADVLVVGGGIGGLMAAISAAGSGAKVIVAEKADTRRSGNGAMGNDHFLCYIPEVHGQDIDGIVKESMEGLIGKFQDGNLIKRHMEESFDRVKDWDSWGIPMKVGGRWEFTGHAFPGRPRVWLKYAGLNQKPALTTEALKRGVVIMNRLCVSEVLAKNGEVIGALAISTQGEKPRLKVFRAKTVVLATGHTGRLYPSITPGWMFNVARCPSCVGSGRAIAYRAGAKLVNMELPDAHAGLRYFARSGKGTWIGVLKDLNGNTVGPFVDKPNRDLGDITADIWTSMFSDMFRSGRAPVYMDCSQTSDEDLDYMKWGLSNEGNTATLQYMEREGIDLKKHMIEFGQYETIYRGRGGVEINVQAEASLQGLYATGEELGNFWGGIGAAATFGWIAGENAASRARQMDFTDVETEPEVEEKRNFYSQIMERKDGPGWKEANLAVQQIMKDYAGIEVRSETLLKAGLKYLRDLKEKVYSQIRAEDSHTLMRCLEVVDLITVGEVIFLTALERKESRGLHRRSDFTFTNPVLDGKFMTIRKEGGQPVLEWRPQVK